jgi:hypothetical protein
VRPPTFRHPEDDSTCHVSEETAGAAHATPLAILIGVAGTTGLGWILMIAASFATTSVVDVLATELLVPMGQLFLDVLGIKGYVDYLGFHYRGPSRWPSVIEIQFLP